MPFLPSPRSLDQTPWRDCLRCPRTGQPLRFDGNLWVTPDGAHTYPEHGRIPFLVTRHEDTALLLDEHMRYRGFFERVRGGLIEPHRRTIKQGEIVAMLNLLKGYFESVVKEIDFSSRPRLLDVGAGFGETSQELAKRGAQVLATDFGILELGFPRIFSFFDLTPENLARYDFLDGHRPFTAEELLFDRLVAETERLPFEDGSFDVVFTRSSLHHVKNLDHCLSEMSRVLRKGGLLVVAGEPIRACYDREIEYVETTLDFQEGIDEQIHTWNEFARAISGAGLGELKVIPLLASGGRNLPRLLSRLGLQDPFRKLEGQTLQGLRTLLLNGMGCVVGWSARRTGDPSPRSTLLPEWDPPLAHRLAGEKDLEFLRLQALDSYKPLQHRVPLEGDLPRPENWGFMPFDPRAGAEGGWPMCMRSGLVFARGPIARSPVTVTLYLEKLSPGQTQATFETFPRHEKLETTLGEGVNQVHLTIPTASPEHQVFQIDIALQDPTSVLLVEAEYGY